MDEKRAKMESAATSSTGASNGSGGDDAKKTITGHLINADLLTRESRDKFRKAYTESAPYPHCVFDPICNKAEFERVRDEIVQNLETKYKETDLFKLYQTTDLANIDNTQPELAAKLPTLLRLRDRLYSKEFRAFISEVTGCGELTERVDMAASAYTHGSHLLCHDDVIGTRAVSFILYFSHEGWTEKEGGALELYPLDPSSVVKREAQGDEGAEMLVQGVPTAHPTARHLPSFNTMAIFRVMPGRSYHSVQEVLSDGSPRLSIQGWFHGPREPIGNDMASLNQLKTAAEREAPFEPIANPDAAAESGDARGAPQGIQAAALSEEDTAYLKKYINEAYLTKDAMAAIEKEFEQSSSVQLKKFLKPELASKVLGQCRSADESDGLMAEVHPPDNTGIGSGWDVVGPAHMQRYLRHKASGEHGSEAPALPALEAEVFRAPAFLRYLSVVTGGRLEGLKTETRRFRSGLDYTVAHHGQLHQEAELDATLCFVDDSDELTAAQWVSGDAGGFECYLAAEDEDNVAAEVYCDDDAAGNDLLSVAPSSNTLSLVYRDPGTMRFVKYVSAASNGSRWDISSVYQLHYDEDEEDEDDEEGEGQEEIEGGGAKQ